MHGGGKGNGDSDALECRPAGVSLWSWYSWKLAHRLLCQPAGGLSSRLSPSWKVEARRRFHGDGSEASEDVWETERLSVLLSAELQTIRRMSRKINNVDLGARLTLMRLHLNRTCGQFLLRLFSVYGNMQRNVTPTMANDQLLQPKTIIKFHPNLLRLALHR